MFKILDLKEGTYLQGYLNSGRCIGDRDFCDYDDANKTLKHLVSIGKYLKTFKTLSKDRNLHEFEIVEVPDV